MARSARCVIAAGAIQHSKKSRLPLRAATQLRSRGTGTTWIQRVGFRIGLELPKTGNGDHRGQPKIRESRTGPKATEENLEKRWQSKPGEDQNADAGKTERIGQRLTWCGGGKSASFDEHGHSEPPVG